MVYLLIYLKKKPIFGHGLKNMMEILVNVIIIIILYIPKLIFFTGHWPSG